MSNLTPLEQKLASMNWVGVGWGNGIEQFTTIHEGFGFVLYRKGEQMWVGGLSKETTADSAATHKRKDPREIAAYWDGRWNYKPMFIIPANPELVSAVVLSAYPQL
jgi:hypothetical protein